MILPFMVSSYMARLRGGTALCEACVGAAERIALLYGMQRRRVSSA
jgi:hypothetical protein